MLRMFGSRRSVRRRSVRKAGSKVGAVRAVRVRRGEMSTSQPEKPSKHLLPCHVRLLDGTDLYIQLPVSRLLPSIILFVLTWLGQVRCWQTAIMLTRHVVHRNIKTSKLVPQIDPSVPQPVVQLRRRPLLGPSPG